MTSAAIIQHLEDWLNNTEAEYKDDTSSWGNGYARAIEDVQLEIERLRAGGNGPAPYEFNTGRDRW